MRRTYRSKKDTGGALDHRDVLQNMDERSSAFDAFYIQNIKQTKRELSCVGSSNVYGVASKKVRKRKYVKRIVKEIENVPTMQPIESSSTSTYLTPDKSIRVNKILDPFDMLLNSSSTGHIATADKKDLLVEHHMPKVTSGKTYTRKKLKKVKKINYSSKHSSDSDKENTSNPQPNVTDIRTHELLVETEFNNPKYLDESISKIVNNLSLIDNFERKTANSSFNTSYKYHRNRLSKNCQSPILQKSPLCSTPFKDKYRGKSIYVFSPITSKGRESPNYVTITEENNESSNSIVFLCKEKVSKLSKKQLSPQTTWDDVAEKDNKSLIYDEIEHIQEETDKIENEVETKTDTKNSDLVSEPSLFQITQAEPFLGFSGGITESLADDPSCYLKCIQENNPENKLVNENDINSLQISIDSININDNDKSDLSKCITPEKSNTSNLDGSKNGLEDDINLIESENYQIDKDESYEGENHYEKSNTIDNTDPKNLKTDLENPNKKGNLNGSGDIIDDEDIKLDENPEASIVSNNSSNSYNSSHNSEDADNESMYDTCNSEPSLSEENNQKEPIVAIERMNDSVFIKYYEKMLINKEDSTSSSGSSWSNDVQSDESDTDENENESDDFDENLSKIDEDVQDKNTIDESNASFYNCSQSNTSNTSKNTESDSVETQPNEITITDSSTTEDIESYYEVNANEEIHVSFVTTRRRNEIINDSMFIFDNSYGSSSTDCDKTVLSNEARLSCIDKSNSELDIKTDINIIEPGKDETVQECINGINRITTRKSSRLTRQSLESTDMDSTINEVTMIESGENDEGSKVTGDKTSQFMKEELPKLNEHPDHPRNSVATRKSSRMFKDNSISHRSVSIDAEIKPSIVLQPGKKWERSLSIYRRMTTMADEFDSSILDDEGQKKGRKYRQSVISTMEMQDSLHNESINSRRSTFVSKPSRPTIRFVKDPNNSRISLSTTEIFDDLKGFLNEECDDTVIELSKLSLADSEFEVTVLDNFDETSERIATARDYVLRRCNQTEPILFDECYPETVLKNCHKIGEGVYGEVFLWRGRDGRARVMKIVPIAGTVKVNGETQKDFHEVISEIVIAMELSALRAPIAEIDRYFDEGKDVELLELHAVENATDVFNEVLAVRCVQGPYPSRLLDLWELYDECKGSENDNPASLPADQQYIVLELANAGQDLESYQFTGAQQAHALFQQIAFGLAVGEESFQFEHRDLHWGNVLIAPTEQKFATFVLGGRAHRVPRGGVSATIIDYSLSRVTLPLAAEKAALYNDLATDEQLFEAVGDYQFQVYRLMRDKLGNDWKNFEPYTNILWLHYTVDKMITALRYKRTNTKIHKHYIEKLKGIKNRILAYKSATEYVLTDIEI